MGLQSIGAPYTGQLAQLILNGAILNDVALCLLRIVPSAYGVQIYISLLQVRKVTLNVHCVRCYLHREVMLCKNHTCVECKNLSVESIQVL